MSIEPEDDDTERENDEQARAMMAKLRKDVDSWSKARRESSPGRIAEPSVPVARPVSPYPVARAKKGGAMPPADKHAGTRSKPYTMSHGGETTADYIQCMIDRGAR